MVRLLAAGLVVGDVVFEAVLAFVVHAHAVASVAGSAVGKATSSKPKGPVGLGQTEGTLGGAHG